jgi:flagellar hook-length control protein FliK
MDDSNAVHKALDSFISELPSALSAKDMPLEQLKLFDSQLLQIFADGEGDANLVSSGTSENVTGVDVLQQNISDTNSSEQTTSAGSGQNNVSDSVLISQEGNENINLVKIGDGSAVEQMVSGPDGESIATEVDSEDAQTNIQPDAKAASSQEQVVKLLHGMFGDIGITAEDSPAGLLNKLSQFILNGENVSKEALVELFSSKDMQEFLRNVLEEQMYLTPEDVADGDKVKKLYERLESKTQKLESLLLNAGIKDTPLAQTVADVRGNIDFMNQLNQTYTYVQIPLKMSGQNASGQLYVYTKKRDLDDPERDLTAFLHLDMDNLGATDVSVRLHRKEVDTKFYMESDEAYALVKAHMSELEERLRKKGFNAHVYVENEGKKVNFVNDFLKKDAPSAGQLHRYSFDVRA